MMRCFFLIALLLSGLPSQTSAGQSLAFVSSRAQEGRRSTILSYYDEDDDDLAPRLEPKPSLQFRLQPQSKRAKAITERLGLSSAQHEKLADFADLIVEWNERVNLVSRKDCTRDVIFGRHILPSLAFLDGLTSVNAAGERLQVVDVGTGGGLPGIPMAIARPDVDFFLVDSVGKKLLVVEDMAKELGLENVQVHHGRAEEIVDDFRNGFKHKNAYDICVGRCVTAVPRFCFWVKELMRHSSEETDDGGKLLYLVGGDVEQAVLDKVAADVSIDKLLHENGVSDKRILTIGVDSVLDLAAESGERKRRRGVPKGRSNPRRKNRRVKGQWAQREEDVPKQRGYENFERYGY